MASQIKAQQPLSVANVIAPNPGTGKIYNANNRTYEAPRAIVFDGPAVTGTAFRTNINHHLNIPAKFSFVETQSTSDDLGMRHHFMQQVFQDIPIAGLGYRVHEKNGFVTSANGKAMLDIALEDVSTTISEEQAFNLAVKYLDTADTLFRNGKKLIVSKNFTFSPESFSVAFQFDVDVSMIERWRISIDAQTGEMINKESLVNTCSSDTPPPEYGTGTGLTHYYGQKPIRILSSNNSSRLEGLTAHGGRIGTYDLRNVGYLKFLFLFGSGQVGVYDIFSSGSTYNLASQRDGVSVHWAAEQAYEYYYNNHNRNSYDNKGAKINSYVRLDKNLRNAFWTGNAMAFGDGSDINPFVDLDIVGHELTHGVNDHEANLIYYNESGALDESFADIFGKVIEFETFGNTVTWRLGAHSSTGGIRDMSRPNLKGQPDTYRGNMWYEGYEDNGGVHVNSGVQNYWFYLLCDGGSGVNDREVSYSVNAIGMDTAATIAYRNLTEYLLPSSDYLDSRIGSLLATADLYGTNSVAYREVDKAWDAVGVIDEPIITSFDLYDITATTVKLKGSLIPRGDTVTYHFEYGTTPEFGSSTSIYQYTDSVKGIITGLQSETKYYVRFVATNENGNSYATTEFTTLPLVPLVKIKHTVDVTDTSALLYGQVNPNSLPTSFYFEYGPTPEMGLVSSSYPLPDTTEFLNVSVAVAGLQPRQHYYYKLIATNDLASSTTDSLRFITSMKPVIHSFSPVAATVGTEVTITGRHFNRTTGMNWVNFGATRAEVISANDTEIRVKVPKGASFGPISILDTESGRVAESIREFVPTFTGEFKSNSLQLRAAFNNISAYEMAVHDMDGDGKPDIIASHYQGVTVFQNVNTGGDITNDSFVQSNLPVTGFSFKSLVDFDGNGLKDIVGVYQNGLRVYPNLSVPGSVFFGPPVDLSIGNWPRMQFEDFDNDGYIDVACTRQLSGDSSNLTIFRNQSPQGTLSPASLEQRYSKNLSFSYMWFLTTEDLNNDGTPDIMVSMLDKDYFIILRNNSSPGVFEFEENIVQDPNRSRLTDYKAQDLNNDGWKDIVSHSFNDIGKMTIFQNAGPDITLPQPISAMDEHAQRSLRAGDINGDGKADLLVGDYDGRFILLKNNTDPGEDLSDASFELFEHYGINENNREVGSKVLLNDLNGDGRPEVINSLSYGFHPRKGNLMEIWQNAPSDCLDASLIELEVSSTTVTIVLPPNTTLDDFEIEFASTRYNRWDKIYSTTSNIRTGSYKLRARAKCYLGYNDYHYIEFATECVDLSSFTINNIGSRSASLYAYDLSSMEVQYSEAGKNQWTAVSRYANQMANLLPGTTYDLRYRGRCYTPTNFRYLQFTTLCPAPSELTITSLTFNKAMVSTNQFVRDAIIEYSTDNTTWTAADETGTLFPLIPGTRYFVRGRLACSDVDSDFLHTSFTTPCPKVSGLITHTITPFSANMTWNDASGTGDYSIKYGPTAGEMKTTSTNATSFYLDDLIPGTQYTVSIAPECMGAKDFSSIAFTTSCYVPFNLSADIVKHTTAELSWDDNVNGLSYSIDYSIAGDDVWLTTESVLTKVSLEELRPGTQYEARVHINCQSEMSQQASVYFETSLYEETKIAPNPTANIITIHPSKDLIGNLYTIYDDKGRRVIHGELLDYTFDLSLFPSGIYVLMIEQEKLLKIVRK
ncbi:M4 family metallopeptidase [Fulvivirga sp. M361]|uniref:M4 family metallopeptidase n=1 Tax=Fulvivirga sp. M361 TaxID=2594266 RepID=UPI00162434EF|nr:M4 family metallopeptidase [Fulvivirga sp. M361]